MKLPTFGNNWRARWMHTSRGDRLHRIASVTRAGSDHIRIDGTSACGHAAAFLMPGFDSRMTMPRCQACCRRVGVPYGYGNPHNEGIGKP